MLFQITDDMRAKANEIIANCTAWEMRGDTQYPGESYEQGVKAALMWLLGQSREVPESDPPDGDDE